MNCDLHQLFHSLAKLVSMVGIGCIICNVLWHELTHNGSMLTNISIFTEHNKSMQVVQVQTANQSHRQYQSVV